MTVISPLVGEQAAQEILVAAEAHYHRTVVKLSEIIEDVVAGQMDRTKELKGALSDLGRASQTAFDERAKVEKRIRAEAGIINDYALDMAEARSEIERRLARIRDAAGAGELPGEPE